MKQLFISVILLQLLCLQVFSNDDVTKVEITTDYGKIIIKLYNETPLHKQNFIKLVNEGFYDSTIFHRVIKNFMVQGGECSNKQLTAKYKELIPAEILDTFIHKRGAIAGARVGDKFNPERKSSSTQFYIVQGQVFNDNQLDQIETGINNNNRTQQVTRKMNELKTKDSTANLPENFEKTYNLAIELVQKEYKPFKFTSAQRDIYKTIGGASHLDSGYSIFGEVIEGMDVVDKIAEVPILPGDRPAKPVTMKMKVIQTK